MVKIYISLDIDKIVKEEIYDYNKMVDAINKAAIASQLTIEKDGYQ